VFTRPRGRSCVAGCMIALSTINRIPLLGNCSTLGLVQEYIDKFSELVDQLVAYEHRSDHRYFATRFVDGLKHDIKSIVLV
jgi:hypothetical protein